MYIFSISFFGNLNRSIFETIFSWAHRSPLLDAAGIFLAYYLPALIVFGALFLLFEQRGMRRRFFFFGEAALSVLLARGVITEMIRYFYFHPRPFDALGIVPLITESGSSFPSGHAAFFFALAMTIFFYRRKWGVWYLLFALVNGLARIFAGVHWPLDVVAGAVIGICAAFFVHALLTSSFNDLYHKESDHLVPPS